MLLNSSPRSGAALSLKKTLQSSATARPQSTTLCDRPVHEPRTVRTETTVIPALEFDHHSTGSSSGWEELWARDRWRGSELPYGDLSGRSSQQAILHFEGLVQPCLKEAAKRWVRAGVLSSTTPVTMVAT